MRSGQPVHSGCLPTHILARSWRRSRCLCGVCAGQTQQAPHPLCDGVLGRGTQAERGAVLLHPGKWLHLLGGEARRPGVGVGMGGGGRRGTIGGVGGLLRFARLAEAAEWHRPSIHLVGWDFTPRMAGVFCTHHMYIVLRIDKRRRLRLPRCTCRSRPSYCCVQRCSSRISRNSSSR